MNDEEIISSIALTLIPGIGHIWGKRLVEEIGNATDVFRLRNELPERIPGVNPKIIEALTSKEAFKRAEQEYLFAQKNHIACLTFNSEDYPSRLRECEDAPILLFFKGTANLNTHRVINLVGTRHATDYGTQICSSFLQDLKTYCPDLLVVSGLAYGIDIHAHRNALLNKLSTVGVLAHGLDRIYPSVHRRTAIEMLECGGLLTEFMSGTTPDRHNFVGRNRIVAGMADATIVVESAEKGGALITAEIAESYGRDCFAFPGGIFAEYSKGCNALIRDNKAALIGSATDFIQAMGWECVSNVQSSEGIQRCLFLDLSPEEQKIGDLLSSRGHLHINTLVVETEIPIQKMNALLLGLEMKGMLRVLAGGVYQWLG